jgi:hypothetical protein
MSKIIFNKSTKNKAENEFDIPHFEERELSMNILGLLVNDIDNTMG